MYYIMFYKRQKDMIFVADEYKSMRRNSMNTSSYALLII